MDEFVELSLDVCISEEHYNRLFDLYEKNVLSDYGVISEKEFIKSFLSLILDDCFKSSKPLTCISLGGLYYEGSDFRIIYTKCKK